jgi:uncharacterized membrane protein
MEVEPVVWVAVNVSVQLVFAGDKMHVFGVTVAIPELLLLIETLTPGKLLLGSVKLRLIC